MLSKDQDVPDRSRGAWMVLCAVSLTNVFTYGFSTSFGVFREYYFRTPPYVGSQEVAYIGPLGLGIMQGLTPIFIHFCSKNPHRINHLMWFGAVIMVASSIGAAFSTNPLQLIMTLGLLYGIGGSCVFAPCIALIDQWFVQRRTLANGIFFSISSLAPACLSPLFATTLEKYSSRTTLLGWAVACAVLSVMTLSFVRPRKQEKKDRTSLPSQHVNLTVSALNSGITNSSRVPQQGSLPNKTTTDMEIPQVEAIQQQRGFWTTWIFWLLCVATVAQGLAHFLPALYIPSYAADLGVPQEKASLLITAFQVTCMVSQPLYGALVDYIGPFFPVMLTTLVASASILLCWGLAHEYWPLLLFMILCGATSGAFVVFRSSFATCITNAVNGLDDVGVRASAAKNAGVNQQPMSVEDGLDQDRAAVKSGVDEHYRAMESLVSGVLTSIRGVATVCSGMIGKALVEQSQDLPLRQDQYAEGRWKKLVLFTGITMAGSCLGALAVFRRPKKA